MATFNSKVAKKNATQKAMVKAQSLVLNLATDQGNTDQAVALTRSLTELLCSIRKTTAADMIGPVDGRRRAIAGAATSAPIDQLQRLATIHHLGNVATFADDVE